jgi:TetR/AcrR family transcriptional regulator, cholesterol catabolism regulator
MPAHEIGARAADDWRQYDHLPLTPILEAALDAFEEQGYHGTTVRDIANRAELTMPALYYHHGNKEGVLAALLDIAMDDVLWHVRGALDAAGESAHQRLVNLSTAVVMHMTHRQQLAGLHPEHRFLSTEQRQQYLTMRDELSTLLFGVITDGVADGTFREQDVRFTTRALLGMLQAIADATGGAAYVAARPEDVGSVVREAIGHP